MPDGGDDRPTSGSTEFSATTSTTPSFGISGVGVVDDDGVETGSPTHMTEKDPTKIARKYVLFYLYTSFLMWVFFCFARNFVFL